MFLSILILSLSINSIYSIKCGTQNFVTSFTYGGEEAANGEFPWKAAIFYDQEYICGGSIIGKQHILTGIEIFTAIFL